MNVKLNGTYEFIWLVESAHEKVPTVKTAACFAKPRSEQQADGRRASGGHS
jgi:hypothetical protein